MITHVFKDGTKTNELKDVYVPLEILERVHDIVSRKEGESEKVFEEKQS